VTTLGRGGLVNPDRVEALGVGLIVTAWAAAVVTAWMVGGWPLALAVFAIVASVVGVALVRLAAAMPPPEEGGGVK